MHSLSNTDDAGELKMYKTDSSSSGSSLSRDGTDMSIMNCMPFD